jgi:hypothetical protein
MNWYYAEITIHARSRQVQVQVREEVIFHACEAHIVTMQSRSMAVAISFSIHIGRWCMSLCESRGLNGVLSH